MRKAINRTPAHQLSAAIKNLNTPARASLLYTAANFFSRFCALVFTPIFTRIMPISDYGRFSLFQAYLSILVAISTLEMGGAVLLRGFARFSGEEDKVLLSSFKITAVVSIGATLVFSLVYRSESFFPGALPMMIFSVTGTSFINLFAARCKYFYKAAPFFALTILTSLICPTVALFALRLGIGENFGAAAVRQGATSIVYLACAVTVCLYTLYGIKKKSAGISRTRDIVSYLLRLCLPMIPYYTSVMLVSQLDKIMVEKFLGADMLAKYSVALSVALGISVISSGLSQILSGWLIRRGRDSLRAERVCSLALLLLSLGIIAYLAIAPELFHIIAPESYNEAIGCIYPLSISVIPVFVCGILTPVTLLDEKCAPAAFSGIFALALDFALLISFTERYGIFFAAIAHLVSYLALCFLFLALTKKRFSASRAFALKFICTTTLCSLAALIEYRLASFIHLRLLILASATLAALAAAFKNRSLIFESRKA